MLLLHIKKKGKSVIEEAADNAAFQADFFLQIGFASRLKVSLVSIS